MTQDSSSVLVKSPGDGTTRFPPNPAFSGRGPSFVVTTRVTFQISSTNEVLSWGGGASYTALNALETSVQIPQINTWGNDTCFCDSSSSQGDLLVEKTDTGSDCWQVARMSRDDKPKLAPLLRASVFRQLRGKESLSKGSAGRSTDVVYLAGIDSSGSYNANHSDRVVFSRLGHPIHGRRFSCLELRLP